MTKGTKGIHAAVRNGKKPKVQPQKSGVGIAFDIGTTTIAGAAVDLSAETVLATASMPNPQASRGRDVLSRINAIAKDPGLLAELSRSVVEACNGLARGLAKVSGIKEIAAAGNPAMEHILLGVSPLSLTRVPYRPAFKEARSLPAKDIGLAAGPEAVLYTFPLIGGFVGGDAVAVILALSLHKEDITALAIDIGTNSEIILSVKGSIYATSAAAGPAFEGGEISSGMTAQTGAIQGVTVEGDELLLDCIGTGQPKGICGSGLIGAAGALVKAGVIDPSGRIKNRGEVSSNLANRIKEDKKGNSFTLYKGAGGDVTLTQADIRALQTAKAAIKAGIEVLLRKAGIDAAAVERVYIAGAFGAHLGKAGLEAIQMLDAHLLKDIHSVGDAALTGAIMALISDDKKAEAQKIAEGVRYVPLSGSALFEREFIRSMDF